jgi:mannitol-specific phosphotransferase system IIBC component
MEELKTRIVSLNQSKNDYANKKIKGEHNQKDEKELLTGITYLIAECRRVACDLGISDDGKINRPNEADLDIFKVLNESVNNLKKQIVMLLDSSPDQLKTIMRESMDKQHLLVNKSRVDARLNEMKNRLKEKLITSIKNERK